MIKKVIIGLVLCTLVFALAGCNESEKASSNLSKEADNFNIVRKLTVINNFSDTIVFEMTGNLSITEDGSQLEVTVKEAKDKYKKHFVGMSKFTTYVVEDITGKNVSTSKYTLNFNPKMIIPFKGKNYNEDGSN